MFGWNVFASRRTRLAASVAVIAILGGGAAIAQETVRLGASVSGELTATDDQLGTGEYLDAYLFEGRAGDRLAVSLTSGEFDPYLMIRGPGGFNEDNDDVADGDLNSALDVRLPANGTYRIVATSYAPGETGRYRLVLSDDGAAVAPSPAAAQGGDLSPGRTVNGELAAGDETLTSGEYSDTWTLRVRAGERYVATLRSGAFDPYLMVRGLGLNEDNDDDPTSRGSLNSRLAFTAPADGVVQVIATSYEPGERGAYVLGLETAGSQGQPSAPPVEGVSSGDLTVGGRVSGRLAEGDRQLGSGEYLDAWTLRGRAGQRVELRMTSGEIDPYLMMSGPDGFTAENDDDPDGGTDSRLVVTLPADGAYEVVTTSYEPGETGTYALSAADASSLPDTPVGGRTGGDGELVDIGDIRRGTLAGGDATLNSGEYVDNYRITGRRGERVAISVTSSEFDTYLMVAPPDGEQIDNDDHGESTDSRIDYVFPADGEYAVSVTSFAPGETGAYELSVAHSLGTPRQESVQGGPRVFAVMVGVADYPGDHNDLPYTDEDAEKLAMALRREGVLNPASIVLTNAEATRAGVRSAFQQVAAEAGPDDMFLFFFSGHGTQEDTRASGVEPDGRAEVLALHDGDMTDAELGDLFDGLDTRMALVVIDACFSGGFARNVVDRPGVMGLFSSEEDLTSAVANKFEAGGYLSHFLREGLTGAANIDGDDMVTAGELSTYLRRQFSAEVEAEGVTAETTDGQRGYQHLVVDRGGVQVDDVIIRLGAGAGAREFGGR